MCVWPLTLHLVTSVLTFDQRMTSGAGRNICSIVLVINQLVHKILFYNKFIICLYMFRALFCSSSGVQNCIIQHLVSSHCVGGRPVHRFREDSIST